MTGIIVAFPKIENARNIRNVLVRNGFAAVTACTTGAQVLSRLEDSDEAIVVCSYRLVDMACLELFGLLPVQDAALYGAHLAAIAATCGHLWPVWFGFKGGKGVAVAAGAILASQPVVVAGLAVVFFATASRVA